MRNFNKTLNKEVFYKKYLSIINVFLPMSLSPKEIEFVSSFLSLDKVLTETYMFNPNARKIVREKLKISFGSMSNYINSLVSKKVLVKDEVSSLITLNSKIAPSDYEEFNIKINLKNES